MKKKIIPFFFTCILAITLIGNTAYASSGAEASSSVSYYNKTIGATNVEQALYHKHTGGNGTGCYTTPIYHSHWGSNGTGCYTKANTVTCYTTPHTHSSSCYTTYKGTKVYKKGASSNPPSTCSSCNGYSTKHTYTWKCNYCNATGSGTACYSANCGGPSASTHCSGSNKTCGYSYEHTHSSSCQYTTYSLGCNKTTSTTDGYNTGCHLSNNQLVGTARITPSTTAITEEVTLTASIENMNRISIISYKWNNGSTSNSITVNNVGAYSCTITYKDYSEQKTVTLTYNTSQIKHEVGKLTITPNSTDYQQEIILSASHTANALDNITNTSYQWYGPSNQNLGTNSDIMVQENGNYKLLLNYKENGTSYSIECIYNVNQIDRVPPTFNYEINYFDRINDTIAVTINDVVEEGSGLPIDAYSFDNGTTWVNNKKEYLYGNGTYTLIVRDIAGNKSNKTFTLDCTMSGTLDMIINATPSDSMSMSFNAIIKNYTSYEYVRQLRGNATPNDSNWEVIDITNPIYSEVIKSSSVGTNGFKNQSMSFTVTGEDADDYFYGIRVKCQNESGTDVQKPIIKFTEMQITEIEVIPKNSTLEMGNELDIGDFTVTATYNNNVKRVINGVLKYNMVFGNDSEKIKPNALGIYTDVIRFTHKNIAYSDDFSITVEDTIAPTFAYTIDFFDCVNEKIAVYIRDVVEEGSGLHDKPYSFDNGVTWVDTNKLYLYGDGDYTLCVRDIALNVSKIYISLDCLMQATVSIVELPSETLTNDIYAEFKANIKNYTSYDYIRQLKSNSGPVEDAWEIIDISDSKYQEGVAVTLHESNGFYSRIVTLKVTGEDADEYYYGILAKNQDTDGNDTQPKIYAFDELKANDLTITPLDTTIEAGTTLNLGDFTVFANYNNKLQRIINNVPKYADYVKFDGISEDITPKTVGTYNGSIKLAFRGYLANGLFNLTIEDTTAPVISGIIIEDMEIVDTVEPQEIKFFVSATDNSDSTLSYGVTLVGEGKTPVFSTENPVKYTFTQNGYAYIHVKDESGNVTKQEIGVYYMDLEAPEFESCEITPSVTQDATKYTIIATAKDDCTSADKLLYQFVQDGSVVRAYANDNHFEVTKNGKVEVYVKDEIGKITKYNDVFNVTRIDKTKPVIKNVDIKVSSNFIQANVEATDNLSETLIYGCTSYADTVTQENVSFFQIFQTGDYTFFVIDQAGNKAEKIVSIDVADLTENAGLYSIVSNIMKKPLGTSYEYNGMTYTNTGYSLIVNYKKSIEEDKILTSLNDGAYEEKTAFSVEENGTYVLNSRYTKEETEYTGHAIYQNTLRIEGIDKAKPTISVQVAGNTVTVNTKDDLSGVKKIIVRYKDEEGNTSEIENLISGQKLEDSYSFTIDDNRVYKIYSVDNVGNKSKTMVVSSNGVMETEKEIKTHQVVFVSDISGIMKVQEVVEGYPAIAPAVPRKNGYEFVSWSEDFGNVTKDLYIYPLYEKIPVDLSELEPHYDMTLRYQLVENPFAFSSKYAGNSLIPLEKIEDVSPYTAESFSYTKDTAQSSAKKPSTLEMLGLMVEELHLNSPFVYIPLLFLVFIVSITFIINRKITKEW